MCLHNTHTTHSSKPQHSKQRQRYGPFSDKSWTKKLFSLKQKQAAPPNCHFNQYIFWTTAVYRCMHVWCCIIIKLLKHATTRRLVCYAHHVLSFPWLLSWHAGLYKVHTLWNQNQYQHAIEQDNLSGKFFPPELHATAGKVAAVLLEDCTAPLQLLLLVALQLPAWSPTSSFNLLLCWLVSLPQQLECTSQRLNIYLLHLPPTRTAGTSHICLM